MPLQILWCTRCSDRLPFTGARVERAAGSKLAVRHECGALNEIAVKGETQEGQDLYRVVGEVETAH